MKRVMAMLLVVSMILSGCSQVDSDQDKRNETMQKSVQIQHKKNIEDVHLRDADALYQNEDDTSVVTMYLTVSRGNQAENTDHTWEEINTYSVYDYEDMGVDRYQVAGLLQVGDENGPVEGEVGYGEEVPNATVQVRGQTSSRYPQKNYKIELKKSKGKWRGQRTINLNKHKGDGLRFRNKLMYELIQGVPQIVGMRTQFVHLYVKDLTKGANGSFEDYGLYTQVEQLNQTALDAHGLDRNGQLYKINFFEFYRYPDAILEQNDPNFDMKKFEKHLEIKGSTDHTKLIKMLEDLNDYSIDIEQILKEHFDEENILYWLAFQILTGNVDTQSRNVYLYSPQHSKKWYLIPWDNDGAFFNTEFDIVKFVGKGSWQCGVSNYWGNVLFQRCFKSEKFMNRFSYVMRGMRNYLSEERISSIANRYSGVVKPYLYQMPDLMYSRLTEEQYDQVLAAIPKEVEDNYKMYEESLKKPMPFYIGLPRIVGAKLHITWDAAYDFDAEEITYVTEVSKDYKFEEVIYKGENLKMPSIEIPLPEAGQYFVRVRATNASGFSQDAFNYYVTNEGKNFGMKSFFVNEDGTIGEDVYEE